jgi:hypothetical protein
LASFRCNWRDVVLSAISPRPTDSIGACGYITWRFASVFWLDGQLAKEWLA